MWLKSHQQQAKFLQKSDTRFSNILTFLHPVILLCSQQIIPRKQESFNQWVWEKDTAHPPTPQRKYQKTKKNPTDVQGGRKCDL